MRWPVRISQPGSGGGPPPPGDSLDRFAPKYLVGNELSGDTTDTTGTAAGFTYYSDPGDGTGIAAALSDAATTAGDVWIRPGTYTTTAPFTVPPDVAVRGAGPSTIVVGAPGTINQGLFTMRAGSSLRSMAITHNEPTAPAVPGTSFGVVGLYEAGSVVIEDVIVTSVWSGATNTTLNACFSVSTPAPASAAFMKCFRCSATYEANSNNDPVSNILLPLCGYRAFDANLELLECDSAFSQFGFGPSVLCAGSSAIAGRAAQSLRVEGGRYTAQAIGIASQSTGGFIPQISLVGTRVRCATGFSNTSYAVVKLVGDGSHSVTGSWLKAATNAGVLIDPFGAAAGACRGQIGNNTIETAALSSAWQSNPGGATESYHTFIGNTYKGVIAGQTTANDEVAHNISLP